MVIFLFNILVVLIFLMLGNFIGFFDYGFVLFVGIVVNDILLVIVIVIVWDVINYSNILGGVIIVKLI